MIGNGVNAPVNRCVRATERLRHGSAWVCSQDSVAELMNGEVVNARFSIVERYASF
jgi:hypothetical protein